MSTIEKALEKQRLAAEKEAEKPKVHIEDSDGSGEPQEITSELQVAEQEKSSDSHAVSIDLDRLEQKGFVSLSESRSVVNEEYRAIKRKVLNNAFGPLSTTLKNSNVIMVSSARPNEGKTFTAINLALSIALEKDKTVLLVDADVLRPSIAKILEISSEMGLMEYLLGECDSMSDVICQTNVDKLRIITAGKTHHLSAELLASEKMLQTVKEFSTRYSDRVVIFDTPPLLGINETAILANLAGQAVIVVEENKSRLVEVNEAVSQLSEDMAKGFVVNKSTQVSGKDGNYYYGYYYSSAVKK